MPVWRCVSVAVCLCLSLSGCVSLSIHPSITRNAFCSIVSHGGHQKGAELLTRFADGVERSCNPHFHVFTRGTRDILVTSLRSRFVAIHKRNLWPWPRNPPTRCGFKRVLCGWRSPCTTLLCSSVKSSGFKNCASGQEHPLKGHKDTGTQEYGTCLQNSRHALNNAAAATLLFVKPATEWEKGDEVKPRRNTQRSMPARATFACWGVVGVVQERLDNPRGHAVGAIACNPVTFGNESRPCCGHGQQVIQRPRHADCHAFCGNLLWSCRMCCHACSGERHKHEILFFLVRTQRNN